MTRYACAVEPRDYVKVIEKPTPLGNVQIDVYLQGKLIESLLLPDDTARALAKAIKASAKRAEGLL